MSKALFLLLWLEFLFSGRNYHLSPRILLFFWAHGIFILGAEFLSTISPHASYSTFLMHCQIWKKGALKEWLYTGEMKNSCFWLYGYKHSQYEIILTVLCSRENGEKETWKIGMFMSKKLESVKYERYINK